MCSGMQTVGRLLSASFPGHVSWSGSGARLMFESMLPDVGAVLKWVVMSYHSVGRELGMGHS